MVDASNARRHDGHWLSPAQLRERAHHHRATAARLFNDRLERVLLEEAAALERRAEALEVQAAMAASRPDDAIEIAALRLPRDRG